MLSWTLYPFALGLLPFDYISKAAMVRAHPRFTAIVEMCPPLNTPTAPPLR